MNFENNLSITEIIYRFFAGMIVAILGGFLGFYVAPIFFVLVPIAPVLFITAILGWSPIYAIMGINHADTQAH